MAGRQVQGGQSGQGVEQEWEAEGNGSGKGEMGDRGDRQRRRGRWRKDTLLGKTRHQGGMGEGGGGAAGAASVHHPIGFYLGASNTKHGGCKLGGLERGRLQPRQGSVIQPCLRLPGSGSFSHSSQPAWLHQTSNVQLAVLRRLAVLLRSAVHLHAALQPAGLACRVPAAGGEGAGWREGRAMRVECGEAAATSTPHSWHQASLLLGLVCNR